MMKKTTTYILIVAFLNVLFSCSKVIDKYPLDLRTEGDVWSDSKLAQAYLNRIWYATCRNDYAYESWLGMYGGPLCPGEIVSDNSYNRWNRAAVGVRGEAQLYDATFDAGAYFNNFIDIRKVNIALEHLNTDATKAKFGEVVTNDMLGQAYFAKGLIYFARARAFGGYPIIEKILTVQDSLNLKRASIKETYDYSISLLEKAFPLLNKSVPAGRPGQGAALALLSEVCLQGAAYIKYDMLNGAATTDVTPYYTKCINAVKSLDSLGLYSLEPQSTYGKMFSDFSYASGNPKEIILAQFTPPGIITLSSDKSVELNCYLPTFYADILTSSVLSSYTNAPFSGFTLTGGWQSIAPNPTVINNIFYIIDLDGKARRWNESQLFAKYITVTNGTYSLNAQAAADGVTDISSLMYKNRDQRFYSGIAYDGCTNYFNNKFNSRTGGNFSPTSYKTLDASYGSVTGYLYRKTVPETQSWTIGTYSGYHRVLLRLGRAYLNAAEAYLMKGDYANARNYINLTRTVQGGLPALTSESGEELWKIYIDERDAELILENDRYFTLLRNGIRNGAESISELNGQIYQLNIAADGKSYKYSDLLFEAANNSMKFSRFRYLYPVPQSVINSNPNYTQNPRY